MEKIIKEEIKRLITLKRKTTNMEDHAYYKGKIEGVKRAVRLIEKNKRELNHAKRTDYY